MRISAEVQNVVKKMEMFLLSFARRMGWMSNCPCIKERFSIDQMLEKIEKLLSDDKTSFHEILRLFSLLPQEEKEEIYRKIFIGKTAGKPVINDPLDKDHKYGENFFFMHTKDPLVKAAIRVHRNEKKRNNHTF